MLVVPQKESQRAEAQVLLFAFQEQVNQDRNSEGGQACEHRQIGEKHAHSYLGSWSVRSVERGERSAP